MFGFVSCVREVRCFCGFFVVSWCAVGVGCFWVVFQRFCAEYAHMLPGGGAVALGSDGLGWILRSDPQMLVGIHGCLRCVLGDGVSQGTTHCLTVFVYWNGFLVLC